MIYWSLTVLRLQQRADCKFNFCTYSVSKSQYTDDRNDCIDEK